MFPYPSGRLHMGHVRCYTLGDVINRYQAAERVQRHATHGLGCIRITGGKRGHQKRYPTGGTWTRDNIDYMRGQMQALGFGMDWSREFATCDPSYYHWEQWFFTRLYEKGLVYRKSSVVKLGSGGPDRACQRTGGGRPWLALGCRGGAPGDGTVVREDHGLRRRTVERTRMNCPAGRTRSRPCSVNWIGRSEGDRDRFSGGGFRRRGAHGLYDPSGHAFREQPMWPSQPRTPSRPGRLSGG